MVNFLTHRGFPVLSKALMEKNRLHFRRAVADFAEASDIPWVRSAKGDRKLDVVRPHLDRCAREVRAGVAAIGVAQGFQRVFTATTSHAEHGGGVGVPRTSATPKPTGG